MPRVTRVTLLASCLALLMTQVVAAQDFARMPHGGRRAEVIDAALSVTSRIDLGAISLAEVFGLAPAGRTAAAAAPSSSGGSGAVGLGSWTGGGNTIGELPGASAIIQRTIPDAWQLAVEAGDLTRHYDVDFVLHDAYGRAGRLSLGEDRSSTLGVTLESHTPVVVASEGDFEVLQGGITFYLDLSRVRHAGRYQGSLTVTLNSF